MIFAVSQEDNELTKMELIDPFHDIMMMMTEMPLSSRSRHQKISRTNSKIIGKGLRLVATRVFNVRLLHTSSCVFKEITLWLTQTSVNTLKTQTHEVNAP